LEWKCNGASVWRSMMAGSMPFSMTKLIRSS
jgi:hypothetical protein